MFYILIMVLVSYLLGSIPTSIIAARWLKGIDIREHGSRNAGATNVFRVLGPGAGIVVLLIDMLKGFVPVMWLAQIGSAGVSWPFESLQIIAGLSAVFGHIWTVFAGFKGGKGVGTGAGMLLGLMPLQVGICLLIFAITVAVSRYVSLGSILAAVTFGVVVLVQRFVLNQEISMVLMFLSIFIPALIIFTHRANIGRLIRGQENKIGQKKAS